MALCLYIEKIKTVIEANAKAGKYRTTFAPYGYVKATDEKKLPVVDEPAASVVRRIFEMRSQGINPQYSGDSQTLKMGNIFK